MLVITLGWQRADPTMSLLTAALVLWAGVRLLRDTTQVLMEGAPRGLDPEQVRTAMLDVDTVTDVHHLHLWNLASDVPALSAHIVITGEPLLRDAQHSADRVQAVLADRFAISNVTLELECPSPAKLSAR